MPQSASTGKKICPVHSAAPKNLACHKVNAGIAFCAECGTSIDHKPVIAGSGQVLLLKSFVDVLKENLKGKRFSYSITASDTVPEQSIKLWELRGFLPSSIGIAHVTFEGTTKTYEYPAYFWSE